MSNTETPHPLAAGTAQPSPQIFDYRDRIVVGTPCYGGAVRSEFMTSILDLMLNLNARFRDKEGKVTMEPIVADFQTLENESHIDRARNRIANLFLASPYNWLLFIDSDIVFKAMDVARLWRHGMNGQKLVCGPYALKGIVPQFAVNVVPGAQPSDEGLIECYHGGTGFMLIHRSVFEQMNAAGLAAEYNLGRNDPNINDLKTSRAYFKSGVREYEQAGPLWLSEDYMFSHEWRQLGGKVMVDRGIALEHIGSLKFPANAREIAAAMKELRRIKHPDLPVDLV